MYASYTSASRVIDQPHDYHISKYSFLYWDQYFRNKRLYGVDPGSLLYNSINNSHLE